MIGVFDSGVGGLYALRELRRRLPRADLCYFADEAHLPYGGRSCEELLRLSCRATRFLRGMGACAILIACGTVSSTVYTRLSRDCPLPIYDAATPLAAGVYELCRGTKDPRVLLLATEGSVKAGKMAGGIREHLPHATVRALPCPDFVPLAEHLCEGSEGEIVAAVKRALAPVSGETFDALALGCTHFSALAPHLARVTDIHRIADSAVLCARAAAVGLSRERCGGGGSTRLYTSGDPLAFSFAAARILGGEPSVFHVD